MTTLLRTTKVVACALAVIAFITMHKSASAADETTGGGLVVGIFGGATGDFLRSAVESFTKDRKIQVTFMEGTAAQLLARALAQRANQQIDVMVANNQTFAVLKREGLMEKLDPKIVTELKVVAKDYLDKSGYGQAFGASPVGIQYRTDRIALNRIDLRSWKGLHDPALSKKIILQSPPNTYGITILIALTRISGGDLGNMEPGFAQLKKLLPNVLTSVRSPGQAEDLLTRGEGWLTLATASRAQQLAEKGAPVGFVVPKEGTFLNMNFMVPLKGSKNPDAAQGLVNHFLTKLMQDKVANNLVRVPVRRDVQPGKAARDILGYQADGSPPEGWDIDWEQVNQGLPSWVDSWNRILQQM